MTISGRALTNGLLPVALLAVAFGAQAMESEAPLRSAPKPALSVAIVVPPRADGQPPRSGDLVTVVLTNTSAKTQRVWRESCSWGWSQLSFEARSAAGAVRAIRKVDRAWEKNGPSVDTLEPGQQLTFTAAVNDPAVWSPVLADRASATTTELRAVFTSPVLADPPLAGVWTGRAESPWQDSALAPTPIPPGERTALPPHHPLTPVQLRPENGPGVAPKP